MTDTNLLTLIHYSICTGCSLFTLYASSILLFKKPKKNFHIHTRTPAVYLYFWFTASSSIFLMINATYIFIWWRPGQSFYNPILLYYISGFPTIFINFVPIADFFLCADRCFSVAFPILYRKLYKTILVWIFVFCVVGIFILYIILTNWFAFNTKEPTTTCTFYICLVYLLGYPLIMTYVKYVFCCLNVIAAAILLVLNYFRKSSQKQLVRKLNNSVFILSVLNVAFAFTPAFIAGIFLQFWNIKLIDYLGDFNLTAVCINIALCVCLYWRVFRKHFLIIDDPSKQAKIHKITSTQQTTK